MWESLICNRCTKFLENPKILNCSHSVCEKCLKEISRQQDSTECPYCRATIRSQTDNTLLSCVLKVLKSETNACEEDIACDACFVTGLRNLRCVDCDMLLCTRCLYGHHDNVVTRGVKGTQTSMEKDNDMRRKLTNKERRGANTKVLLTQGERKTVENEEQCENEIQEHNCEQNETMSYEHGITSERNKNSREFHQVHVTLKCKQHRSEELRFFCNSCAQLVCQECVIAEHLLHIFLSASDAAPSCRARLRTLLNQTTIRILYLSEALRETRDVEEKLRIRVRDATDVINKLEARKSKDEPMEEIKLKESEDNLQHPKQEHSVNGDLPSFSTTKDFGKILNAQVNISKQKYHDKKQSAKPDTYTHEFLLKRLGKLARQKLDVLAEHRRKLETRLALFQNSRRFTTNLIHSATDVEVIIFEACVLDNLGKLCQNTPDVPIECPDDAFIAVNTIEDPHSGANEDPNSSGDREPTMFTGEGYAGCCFATGEGLSNAAVGKDCMFTVIVKNEDNKACLEGRNSIIARVKTPNCGYFRAELFEHKHGKHKFRYRSYSTGVHVLRITLRGEEILGSPFEALCSGSTDYSRRGRLVTKFGRLGNNEGELCRPQGEAPNYCAFFQKTLHIQTS